MPRGAALLPPSAVTARSPLCYLPPPSVPGGLWRPLPNDISISFPLDFRFLPSGVSCDGPKRAFHVSAGNSNPLRPFGGFFANLRGSRKTRRRQMASKKQTPKENQLHLDVKISIEDDMPSDPEVLGTVLGNILNIETSTIVQYVSLSSSGTLRVDLQHTWPAVPGDRGNIVEMLKLNVPMAMKVIFDCLKDSEYKMRDTSIDDIAKFDKVELSVLLSNDDFIQRLNKDWRGEDHATDVISMSQHIPELDLPVLMLGDLVISVETAARQAEERGHTLLDEIRILMVHGLLHLLGFDHEISDEAESEMENEEEVVLKSLGWKGKGLIKSAFDSTSDGGLKAEEEVIKDPKKAGNLRFYKPKFNFIFCDMDGTLLNSKSQITTENAEALREAMSRGVNIVIATGKTRPAVVRALKMVDLVGTNNIFSEFSPGIFLQGLLVYGRQGREIYRSNLDQDVCREAFMYSLEREVPLIAFSQDRCFTLFDHPLVDSLHTVYHEPKAEVMPSIEHLLSTAEVQKLLFLDTAEGVSSTLRPHWEEATSDRAKVVQAQADMLEIVPAGTSKGNGVRTLLNHFDITANEIMAIGDGENDVEMLRLASFGVALANGSEKAKSVANVIGVSNDEDGVAKAIYEYAF